MDELNQLMAELPQSISTLNKLSESLDPPTEDYTETDADRVVTISCRPNGALISIRIADNWRNKIEPDMLADRLNQTMAAAQLRAMGIGSVELTGKGRSRDDDSASQERIDLTSVQPTAADRKQAEQYAQRSYQEFVNRVDEAVRDEGAALERFYSGMDKLNRALADEVPDAADEEQHIYSENHKAWAVLTPAGVNGFDFKANWVKNQTGITLTNCLREIIEQLPADETPALIESLRAFKA